MVKPKHNHSVFVFFVLVFVFLYPCIIVLQFFNMFLAQSGTSLSSSNDVLFSKEGQCVTQVSESHSKFTQCVCTVYAISPCDEFPFLFPFFFLFFFLFHLFPFPPPLFFPFIFFLCYLLKSTEYPTCADLRTDSVLNQRLNQRLSQILSNVNYPVMLKNWGQSWKRKGFLFKTQTLQQGLLPEVFCSALLTSSHPSCNNHCGHSRFTCRALILGGGEVKEKICGIYLM